MKFNHQRSGVLLDHTSRDRTNVIVPGNRNWEERRGEEGKGLSYIGDV
tara:strand:+ start:10816 stop:10959 length:144 start_codon:yes stop_codon:yes gene_type:complete